MEQVVATDARVSGMAVSGRGTAAFDRSDSLQVSVSTLTAASIVALSLTELLLVHTASVCVVGRYLLTQTRPLTQCQLVPYSQQSARLSLSRSVYCSLLLVVWC